MKYIMTTDVKPILVLNMGSSSLKYALIAPNAHPNATTMRIEGLCENVGTPIATITHQDTAHQNTSKIQYQCQGDVSTVLTFVLDLLKAYPPCAVAHRVVHGGDFSQATLIDDTVIKKIEALASLAPLHNPVALRGIYAIKQLYPHLPQVAVFDTAFHQSMPAYAYRYALPSAIGDTDLTMIRKYGFHGSSHAYVAQFLANAHQTDGFIIAHLGNGCSATAVYDGKSMDTTMGFTPLEGLMMGTRTGDIDPAIILYLLRLGKSVDEIDTLIHKKSGLFGVSHLSNDLRTLENSDSAHARLAIEMFAYRTAKAILALSASLPQLTAIAFTGGIGENSADMRKRICAHLTHLGVHIDIAKNDSHARGTSGRIDNAGIALWVVKTDEEGQIAKEAHAVLTN